MVHFVNSHGIEVIIFFYVFSCIVGGMPILPSNASYGAKWAYTVAHLLAGNLKAVARLMNLPDMPGGPPPIKEPPLLAEPKE